MLPRQHGELGLASAGMGFSEREDGQGELTTPGLATYPPGPAAAVLEGADTSLEVPAEPAGEGVGADAEMAARQAGVPPMVLVPLEHLDPLPRWVREEGRRPRLRRSAREQPPHLPRPTKGRIVYLQGHSIATPPHLF